ncbi:MAG TPA: 3-methyl-2-oxobutanoate hydroxymethyltransferase, partial [Chloroflexota bacterium]|nr:3-methyl-2-oxobutanoate hydroxymethyltransferase [Chloroflexota bacterium]
MHDILGYDVPGGFVPKHAKRYANLGELILEAVKGYVAEVRAGQFPSAAQSFTMDESVLKALGESGAEQPRPAKALGDPAAG